MGAGKQLNFNRTPPNQGSPFNKYEEGQWYHPEHVTASYLDRIATLSEEMFGDKMVRRRHSWYAEHGFLINGTGAKR